MKQKNIKKTKPEKTDKKEMKAYANQKAYGVDVWKIKASLPLALIGLGIIISFSLVFLPKIKQVKDFGIERKKTEAKIVDVNQRRAYIQSVDDAEFKKRHETLLMALPESKNIYFLLNVVSDIVSDYGFNVDSFVLSPGDLKNEDSQLKKDMSKLDFNIVLVGLKDRYTELINGLENSLPLLSINELGSKSVSQEFVEIELSLSTYFANSDDDIDVSKLTYKDLLMTKEELAVLERLDGFKRIEGLFLEREGLDSGKEYIEYEISDPFLTN